MSAAPCRYSAPELLLGNREPCTFAADMYSLGVVLVSALLWCTVCCSVFGMSVFTLLVTTLALGTLLNMGMERANSLRERWQRCLFERDRQRC